MPQKQQIMFVCTGNTCRSPMAEALARHMMNKMTPRHNFTFTSAGTGALPGQSISPQAAQVLQTMGIESQNHRATLVQPEHLQQAALILTMTGAQAEMLRQYAPRHGHKIHTLAQYAHQQGDVPDPFGRNVDFYRLVANHIASLLQPALQRIAQAQNQA